VEISVSGRSDASRHGGGTFDSGSQPAPSVSPWPLRRAGACITAAFLVLLGALSLTSAPALALSQRGHAFSFAFGEPGKTTKTKEAGPGQFYEPTAIAVNNSTGEVYVADRRNKRVQQFKPVLNSGSELVGEQYVRSFAVSNPQSIAVDNSTSSSDPSKGDVYVAGGPAVKDLDKFTSEGVPIYENVGKYKIEGESEKFEVIEGIAVDTTGTVFVYQEGSTEQIVKLNDAGVNEGESVVSSPEPAAPGVAVDSQGNLYVGAHPAIEALKEREREERRALSVVSKLEGATGNVLNPELVNEDTTAVAANPADNAVYLDTIANIAGKHVGAVAAFDSSGSPIQRFSAPGLTDPEALAVDATNGVVFVADATADKVDVFGLEPAGAPTVEGLSAQSLVPVAPVSNATTLSAKVDPNGGDTHYYFEYGSGDCATEPASCTKTTPVDAGSSFSDQSASLELQNLAPGTYHYRVVAENSFNTTTSAEREFTILALVSGLPDGRGWELVSPPEKDGAEVEPITKEGGEIQASEDGHAISYVADGPMPAKDEPEGNRNLEYTQVLSSRGSQGWISKDIITPASRGSGINVGRAPEYQLFSPNLSLALVEPSGGNTLSGKLEEPPLSPPVTPAEEGHQEKTIYLRDDAPLQPGASEEANYRAAGENGEKMHNPGFLALVTKASSPGGAPEFGGGETEGLEFVGASPDLGHVVFQSYLASPGLWEWGGASAALQLVSALPGGAQVKSATLGGPGGHDVRNAVSKDGSRVFWSTTANPIHLYMRNTVAKETLQLDTVQPGTTVTGPEVEKPVFQTASADGSKVFFTDTQRLTPDSHAGGNEEPDLYVYEPPSEGKPATLKDLTPEGLDGGNGDVLVNENDGGGVIGASEDGSSVYFVSNAVLASGAARGNCAASKPASQPRGTTCNLYMRHYSGGTWAPAKLVTVLSGEDRSDWGGTGILGDLAYMSARVSPKGEYLAFMSNRSLTGYDNEDVSSKTPGERMDEEVYLYHAGDESLVCASCDPTGARPVGIFDPATNGGGGAGEGIGLVVDRPLIWTPNTGTDSWLAASLPGWTTLEQGTRALYQSRYLSDSGRLFFNSADALVHLAVPTKPEEVEGTVQQVGNENVYEYQPGGLGSCQTVGGCVGLISSGTSEHESAFLDASTTGNDIFFVTAAPLTSQDVDGNFDVYDAHVCEAASPCPPPPPAPPSPCNGEECQAPYTAGHSFPTSGTVPPNASGNVVGQTQVLASKQAVKPTAKPLTRAQKYAKALKACRKLKKKSKRRACEKQAKKKYGPIKSTAKKSSGSKGR